MNRSDRDGTHEYEKMTTMPRDSSRYVANSQSCERKTRSTRSSNFVDSLLPAASTNSSPSSGSAPKKARLNSHSAFGNDESSTPAPSTVNSISDTGIESSTVSVQSFLASSALSSLIFGANACGKEEKSENGNLSSERDSSSPRALSGRSSAMDGYDVTSAITTQFFGPEDDECSPPPMTVNANGDANGSNYYACAHCNKYFWTETSLKHHSSLYHSEKSFVCEICGKAFRFRSNLAEHRSVHTSLKPYVCKFCGKSSRLKGNLTKHILKHHKKEQNAYIGKDDIIIKKGKKSVKDPAAVDFLEKSMIILTSSSSPVSITTTPLPSTAGKQASTAAVSSTNPLAGGPFSLNTADLGAAALQLLSIASKTDPGKSPKGSSGNKRSHNGQAAPTTTPSSMMVNGGNKAKPEKSHSHRDTSSIFSSSTMKAQPFLPVSASSNGKSPISNAKEMNRFPMLTTIGEDFVENAGYLFSADGAQPKFDYDDVFGSTSRTQPTARDVDAIFESLLGRHLPQPEINCSPPSDDLANSHLGLTNHDQTSTSGGAGTRCHLCGKHFRKSANLAVHMTIKHNQAPAALPVLSSESPPPQSAPVRNVANSDIAAFLNMKFPTLVNQSISQPKMPLGASTLSSFGKADPSKSGQKQHSACSINESRQPLSMTSTSGRSTISAESSSASAAPQLDTLNGLMTKSGVSKDLKEIRNVLQELKRGLPDVAKLDELLSALDSRVDRLERQLETSVNTLYILVQMQTDMNSAFCQFKNDVVQRLKSLKAQHAEEEESDDLEEEEDGEHCNGELEAENGSA